MRAAVATLTAGPRVVVPIVRLDRAALQALAFARTISDDVTALHVAADDHIEELRIRERWRHSGDGVALEIVPATGRPTDALLHYLDGSQTSTVVIPEFVPRRRWLYPFHNLDALLLKLRLLRRPDTVVISAPYRAEV